MNKHERLNNRIEAAERALARTLDIRERVIREIVRTERKLKLVQSELERLKRVRVKRLAEAADSNRATAEPAPANGDRDREPTQTQVAAVVKDDGLPDYLRRDQIAREKIQSELAAKKKAAANRAADRRKVKREMVKADLTGATRKMPLEGKVALAAIHSGK